MELRSSPNSSSLKLLRKEGINSNLIVPMTVGEGVLGFFFFSSTKEAHFDEELVRLREKIVNEAKAVLNRAYYLR
jgi:GAF domain-containing protein